MSVWKISPPHACNSLRFGTSIHFIYSKIMTVHIFLPLMPQKCNFKEKPFVFVDKPNGQTQNKIKHIRDETISHFVVCRNIDYQDLSNMVTSRKEHSNMK